MTLLHIRMPPGQLPALMPILTIIYRTFNSMINCAIKNVQEAR